LTGGEAGPVPAGDLDPVAPRYGEASLADLMPGVLASLGVPGAADPLGLAAGALAGVTRVAVLLVDGLGHHQLPLAAPHAPTLADVVAGRLPGASAATMTAGFPSTTPTSLATLGTGAPPGAHGLVGFTVKVPGRLRVLNHIEWVEDPDPLRWQPLRTQFERAAEAGVTVRVVSRPEFEASGLTVAAYRGGSYRGVADVDTAALAMIGALTEGEGPALVYGYHPDVDKAGHRYGVDSPQWREAVADVDRLLTRLVDGLPPGAALVVTADHGQLNVPATHRFDLDSDRRLRAGVWAVAGEPRVRYLHTRKRAVADVVATWRGVLGDAAWVAPREEVVAAGWFGPIGEDHLRRVGDVVVICRDRYAVLATARERPMVAKLIAFHGSSTALEMMIPLLIVRTAG
jgi:hypothetical protein